MRIMYLITRQFQILLHLRDMAGKGFDNQTMAQKAGIPPFAVKRNLTQARGFGAGQLRQALEEGVALEEAVKTGRMNDQMAVELFIIRYSAAKQKNKKNTSIDGTGVFHTVGLGPYVKIYSLELSQRVNKLC
mgnify:CR=1 FL=1